MMSGVGALVTLELPADSPALDLPWIITIGPLTEEEEWEAIVLGPYEHGHALALAEEIVSDDQLMAVVEPVTPLVSVDAIREEIAIARAAALEAGGEEEDDDADSDAEYEELADEEDDEDGDEEDDEDGDDEDDEEDDEDEDDEDEDEHLGPPTPEEVRAGVARVAARLLAENLTEESEAAG
jgi:hypothetical protein